MFDYSWIRQEKNSWLLQNEISILKLIRTQQMPGIVDLYQEPGGVHVVMDYMEGPSLEAYIQKHGPVSEQLALAWMEELCQLIGYLHNLPQPVIYCDLKPENLVVQKNGHLALVDFGSARVAAKGQLESIFYTGTKGYSAPELFETENLSAEQLTPDLDVYSIGAVGAYMVTGFGTDIAGKILIGDRKEEGLVSKAFQHLLLHAMAKKQQRIKDCHCFLRKILKIKKENRTEHGI